MTFDRCNIVPQRCGERVLQLWEDGEACFLKTIFETGWVELQGKIQDDVRLTWVLHRIGGPAVISNTGQHFYYLDDLEYDKTCYQRKLEELGVM